MDQQSCEVLQICNAIFYRVPLEHSWNIIDSLHQKFNLNKLHIVQNLLPQHILTTEGINVVGQQVKNNGDGTVSICITVSTSVPARHIERFIEGFLQQLLPNTD